jgi:hypothetical protein
MVGCPKCQVYWGANAEPGCADPSHGHREFGLHLHRSALALPDGTQVTPVTFDAADPYAHDQLPDFGLYLDQRWQPPWPHEHLEWPDFDVPGDSSGVVVVLGRLLDKARAGERVELGCLGGHGRTGTALACLVVLTGYPATGAVSWVRTNYCDCAVETADQEAFVLAFQADHHSVGDRKHSLPAA